MPVLVRERPDPQLQEKQNNRLERQSHGIDLRRRKRFGTVPDSEIPPKTSSLNVTSSSQYQSVNQASPHTLTVNDLLSYYSTSEEFRTIIRSGKYIWVDNYLCVKRSECFTVIRGKFAISKRITHFPENYLVTISSGLGKTESYSINISDGISESISSSFYNDHIRFQEAKFKPDIINSDFDLSKFRTQLSRKFVFGNGDDDGSSHNVLDNMLTYYKHQYGYSDVSLGKAIGVSPKTIERFRTDLDNRTKISTVIAICLMLNIPPSDSYRIIELAGYRLRSNPLENAYSVLLDCFWDSECNMRVYNNILLSEHLPALTSLLGEDEPANSY